MKTQSPIDRIKARARKWAEAHPGEEYRKTVIRDDPEASAGLCVVPRWFYEETCEERDYVGEVFAIKEAGRACSVSFDAE